MDGLSYQVNDATRTQPILSAAMSDMYTVRGIVLDKRRVIIVSHQFMRCNGSCTFDSTLALGAVLASIKVDHLLDFLHIMGLSSGPFQLATHSIGSP